MLVSAGGCVCMIVIAGVTGRRVGAEDLLDW